MILMYLFWDIVECTITIDWCRVPRVDNDKDSDVIVFNVEGHYNLQLQLIGGYSVILRVSQTKCRW